MAPGSRPSLVSQFLKKLVYFLFTPWRNAAGQHPAEPPLLVSEPVLEAPIPGSRVWALLSSVCRAPGHRAPTLPPSGAPAHRPFWSVWDAEALPGRKPEPWLSVLGRKDTETRRETRLKPGLTPEFAPSALLQTAYMSLSPRGLFITWTRFAQVQRRYHGISHSCGGTTGCVLPACPRFPPKGTPLCPLGFLPSLPPLGGFLSLQSLEADSDGDVLGGGGREHGVFSGGAVGGAAAPFMGFQVPTLEIPEISCELLHALLF